MLLRRWREGKGGKQACRVGREVAHLSSLSDPDERMSHLQLFRRCGSGLRVSPPFRSLDDMVSNVNAVGLVPYGETVFPARYVAPCKPGPLNVSRFVAP